MAIIVISRTGWNGRFFSIPVRFLLLGSSRDRRGVKKSYPWPICHDHSDLSRVDVPGRQLSAMDLEQVYEYLLTAAGGDDGDDDDSFCAYNY